LKKYTFAHSKILNLLKQKMNKFLTKINIMKKILLLLVLTMSLLATAHAGFVIRGIDTSVAFDLKNFTLTLNNDEPVSAASMYTTDGGGTGSNSIVIIPADTNVSATYFPFTFGLDEDFSFEVRDFHYDATNNLYILCGSRKNDIDTFAFLAVINIASATMDYNEYTNADIFYSMCAPNDYLSDYYVCGKSGNYGAIASISKSLLNFTNLFITDYEWVCHKIIEKPTNSIDPRFAISGRNPECTGVGYTAIDPSFTLGVTYFWGQLSEQDALCVVCEDATDNNNIILATSYQNRVTLNTVLFSGIPQLGVQHYYFTPSTNFYVQDIGMIEINKVTDSIISIAGYMTDGISPQHQAWYGYVNRLNITPIMSKNYYQADGQYEHYKIRYAQSGEVYTGGYFQGDNDSVCALFGTPQQIADECESIYGSIYLAREPVYILSLALPEQIGEPQISISSSQQDIEMPVYIECEP
jgi:hypothetical protein